MKRPVGLRVLQSAVVRENLTLTSQLPFCGLPLRLDAYVGCSFDCGYCFARRRGGATDTIHVRAAEPGHLRRMLDRAISRRAPGVLAQCLRRRLPIHFGGMSDPFQASEEVRGVSLAYLEALAHHRYPVVISTRSPLLVKAPYLERVKSLEYVVVQYSFSTTDDVRSRYVEPLAPSPSAMLSSMERLSREGVHVTSRWQPLIPGFSEDGHTFVQRVSSAGARHVAVEHLKVPVETDARWLRLEGSLGRSLRAEYLRQGATRDGREFVLPPDAKLPRLLAIRDAAHHAGLTFGSADNEYQYLSDTECCCSGVDQFPGFENWYAFQIAVAVRRSRGGAIKYEAIGGEWRPRGSVDRYLNSRSRLDKRGVSGTAGGHMRFRFAGGEGGSPERFAGVVRSQARVNGLPVYEWDDRHRALWSTLVREPLDAVGQGFIERRENRARHGY